MASCGPLHTCELCGQEGLSENDMRSHMRLVHVEGSPACPFCDLGDLSHEEMELHVNSAHLDFLTPEGDSDGQYLEGDQFGSLWELDRWAREEPEETDTSPIDKSRESITESFGIQNDPISPNLSPRISPKMSPRVSPNPFVDSDDQSDTEEDTTICSIVEKVQFAQSKETSPASPRKKSKSDQSSPKLDKGKLTLPLRRPTGGCSPPVPLTCPMCPYSDHDPDKLQEHVNRAHLDLLSPAVSQDHPCPLCNKPFTNPTQLQTHFTSAHPDTPSPAKPPPPGGQDSNVCPVCGETGWSRQQLQLHVESHFASPVSGNQGMAKDMTGDHLVAQEMVRKERDQRKWEEEKQFASLQAQYGMDEQGNFTTQSTSGLRKAVVSGQLSVVDFYEKSAGLVQSVKSGLDDGSSVTVRISQTIKGLSQGVKECLVASKTDHYASTFGDKGWGCGYRNLQMMMSCLLDTTQYRDTVAGLLVGNMNLTGQTVGMPSIPRIQRIIEEAWRAGFDLAGCEQLGGRLSNTRKWIGATEISTFLSYCNIDNEIIDFHCPTSTDGSHPKLFEWAVSYFRKGRTGDVIPPLYLQHQGHSRTIVGVEIMSGGGIKLLILDPSHSPTSLAQNMMRSVRKTLGSMKSKQYQVVRVKGRLESARDRDNKKMIVSTRVPGP